MAFQRFEWCPCVELLQLTSKRQDATGGLSQRQPKDVFFSRVSEATLGTFSGHFWSVLGTKLGGVSAFRVVSEENKTKELEFHVEILWDSLGFAFLKDLHLLKVFFRVSLRFLSNFMQGLL